MAGRYIISAFGMLLKMISRGRHVQQNANFLFNIPLNDFLQRTRMPLK
jgi:hypothetical protein